MKKLFLLILLVSTTVLSQSMRYDRMDLLESKDIPIVSQVDFNFNNSFMELDIYVLGLDPILMIGNEFETFDSNGLKIFKARTVDIATKKEYDIFLLNDSFHLYNSNKDLIFVLYLDL